MDETILFDETHSDVADFLHELAAPDLLRSSVLSESTSTELRRQQVSYSADFSKETTIEHSRELFALKNGYG